MLCIVLPIAGLDAAEDDAPLPEPAEGLEIEPPILIKSRDQYGLPEIPALPQQVELAKIEKDLARAKRYAASAERLYKAGIIAKVEAEERVLRVVRLEAQLAEARLREAKDRSEAAPSPEELAQVEEAAKRAQAERRQAEIEAAFRNLQRQQKLLALGSGRKADVTRAEKKLTELQGAAPSEAPR